jgi:hypothetical protein
MPITREEEEQGVAAELEHVPAATFGNADQAFEDPRDCEHQFFSAGAAFRLQTLRQTGETRQVDRDERPVELTRPHPSVPFTDEAR